MKFTKYSTPIFNAASFNIFIGLLVVNQIPFQVEYSRFRDYCYALVPSQMAEIPTKIWCMLGSEGLVSIVVDNEGKLGGISEIEEAANNHAE